MDQLLSYINYIANNSLKANEEKLYQLLSVIDVSEAQEEQLDEIINKLYQLCKEEKLSKYYVYLSCMANDNCTILEKFIECDKAKANLNAISKIEIFEYVVFKRKHWFLKVLDEFENLGRHFNESVYQKILIAKLIGLTNATEIDVEKIGSILNAMYTNEDKFIEFYKKEVKKVLNVMTFMEGLNLSEIRTNEVFYFIICNSLLSSLSKYARLQEKVHWIDIESHLRSNDKQYYQADKETSEVDIFLSFTIIFTILNVAISSSDERFVKEELETANNNFFKITSTKLQIEVIKILFIIIFLRKNHLNTSNEKEGQEYLNNSIGLNIILQFLKNIFEAIKIQNKFDKESQEYKTFMKFNKYLVDAIWRHDLISHVKASKLHASPHRLIPYMLAPPESLIYMCLKHKNFERAQQVIRVSL